MTKLGRPPSALPATAAARAAWQRHRPKPSTGQLAALARVLGITQANFNHWDQVPKKYHKQAAEFLGVQPSDLRPDLYPPPWAAL